MLPNVTYQQEHQNQSYKSLVTHHCRLSFAFASAFNLVLNLAAVAVVKAAVRAEPCPYGI
jgi:hypothetical protein